MDNGQIEMTLNNLNPDSLKCLSQNKFGKHQIHIRAYSPVENKNDLELDFKVFFFTDSCCSDIVHDESN